jgi:hypothetical protein
VVATTSLVRTSADGHTLSMTDSKKPKSPAQASREGLSLLTGGRRKHGSTAHTPAVHPNGPKFDEEASEVHRGTVTTSDEH